MFRLYGFVIAILLIGLQYFYQEEKMFIGEYVYLLYM